MSSLSEVASMAMAAILGSSYGRGLKVDMTIGIGG